MMLKAIIPCVIIFFTAVCSVFPAEVGEEAPKFANPDLDGNFIISTDIIKKGWVILDFFATDCKPCKEEIPELEHLFDRYAADGLRVIVFATDQEGCSVVNPFFAKNPTGLLVVIDRYKVTASNYEVKEIPTVFLVDPHGKIVLKGVGYQKAVLEKMKSILEKD